MKQGELIALGLAGLAVYMIWKSRKPTTTSSAGTPAASSGVGTSGGWVDEIFGTNGLPYGNGWRYFENGVAIDPAGNYYQGGQLVWSAK